MSEQNNQEATIQQPAIEDLNVKEDQEEGVKGGIIRGGNTYTGTTTINSGILD